MSVVRPARRRRRTSLGDIWRCRGGVAAVSRRVAAVSRRCGHDVVPQGTPPLHARRIVGIVARSWSPHRGPHDPDDAVPRAHERAQRDRPVEPLVRPPGRQALPDLGQVRVLRRPQRRRRSSTRRRCTSTGSTAATPSGSWPASWPATSGPARPGHAQYTIWCDDRGFVVEDGVMLRHGQDEFLLTAAEPNLAYFAGPGRPREQVTIEEVSRRLRRSSPSRARGRATWSRGSSPARPTSPTSASPSGEDRRLPGDGLADRLHRRPRLRGLDRQRRRAHGLGHALGVGRGLRRAAVRPRGAVHAPHRGRPAAARRRLRVEPLRLDGRGPLDPDRARLRLDAPRPRRRRPRVHRAPGDRARARRQDLALADDRAASSTGRTTTGSTTRPA